MSDFTVKLRWKVVTILDNQPPIQQNNILFNHAPNTGLYSQFSVPLWHGYIPNILTPTNTYHQIIKNLLKKRLGVKVSDNKFPYKIYVPGINAEVSLNLQIRLFPTNILSLTIKLSEIHTNLDVERLIDFQRLDHLRPISDIAQWTIGMIKTLDHKNFHLSQPLRFRPMVHLNGISSPERFTAHIGGNVSKYVGMLIRNYDYELMDSQVTDMILEKNKEHNVKSSQELLLLDKQGVLYLTPYASDKNRSKARQVPRFSRAYDLFEIGLVFSNYLRNYPSLQLINEDFHEFILYKIRPWIDEPDIVFSRSRVNEHMWRLILEELRLESRMSYIMERNGYEAISKKSKYFDQFADGWWEEKDIAYLIAKKVQESQDIQFEFLGNESLKRLIIEDFAEARGSYRSKNYKATILLCGSIAEAILTDTIGKAHLPGITTQQLYKYNLSKLIDMAKDNDLIKDKTLFSLLDPLRHYRNMIHPGVQIRKSLIPDSSKASIALETINLLAKNLSDKMAP